MAFDISLRDPGDPATFDVALEDASPARAFVLAKLSFSGLGIAKVEGASMGISKLTDVAMSTSKLTGVSFMD